MLLAAVILAAVVPTISPSGVSASTPNPVISNAEWILTAQRPDGSITFSPNAGTIWPYLSNLAATGLSRAALATGDGRYVAASWRWLDWYQANQDASGVVADYTIVGGVERSTGQEDSTDAYAGTFLSAVGAAHAADPSISQISRLHRGIGAAVTAIEAVQDVDGLTFAKPSWRVKYLMDQSETYAGLVVAATLATALGDGGLAQRASGDAARLKAGVASLWDPADGAYDWALHGETGHQHTNWAQLYPDALEQLWPVAYGLADAATTATVVSHFSQAHPQWSEPTASDEINGSQHSVGYQAVAGVALSIAGNGTLALAGAARIEAAAEAVGRAWPFTPGDAGELIALQTPQFGGLLRNSGTVPAGPSAPTAPAPASPGPAPAHPAAPGSLAPSPVTPNSAVGVKLPAVTAPPPLSAGPPLPPVVPAPGTAATRPVIQQTVPKPRSFTRAEPASPGFANGPTRQRSIRFGAQIEPEGQTAPHGLQATWSRVDALAKAPDLELIVALLAVVACLEATRRLRSRNAALPLAAAGPRSELSSTPVLRTFTGR